MSPPVIVPKKRTGTSRLAAGRARATTLRSSMHGHATDSSTTNDDSALRPDPSPLGPHPATRGQ